MYYRVMEAMQIHMHGMPSKNSTNKKIRKESKNSGSNLDLGMVAT